MSTIYLPHETAPLRRMFTCWPSAADLWEEDLEPAQAEFGQFLRAVTEPGTSGRKLELVVLAATAQAEASARDEMGRRADVVRAPFGDVVDRPGIGPIHGRAQRPFPHCGQKMGDHDRQRAGDHNDGQNGIVA